MHTNLEKQFINKKRGGGKEKKATISPKLTKYICFKKSGNITEACWNKAGQRKSLY